MLLLLADLHSDSHGGRQLGGGVVTGTFPGSALRNHDFIDVYRTLKQQVICKLYIGYDDRLLPIDQSRRFLIDIRGSDDAGMVEVGVMI